MKELFQGFLGLIFVIIFAIIYYYNFSDRADLLKKMQNLCYSKMVEYAPNKKIAKKTCECIIDEVAKNLTIQEAIDIKKHNYAYSLSHWADEEKIKTCGEKYYEE